MSRWLTLLTLLVHMSACSGSMAPDPRIARRFTDLLRLVENKQLPSEQSPVEVWTIDGDTRPVLPQPAPNRLRVGPLGPARECSLRVGLGLEAGFWQQSDGVEFRVSVERARAEEVLFTESVVPTEIGDHRWLDREIPVPNSDAEPFSLVLETQPGPNNNRDYDVSGWGSPHLVCTAEVNPPAVREHASVFLISIDTLRWDHLGLYGYDRPTSPVLDAFATESMVFEQVFTTAPWTLASHASLFTGLYPADHKAGHAHPRAPLAEEMTTLAELMGAAGYRTLAFTGGGSVTRQLGLHQGFEEWTQRQRANLRWVLPSVFDALGRSDGRPMFVFIHTYDVHAPYEQPPDARYFQARADSNTDTEGWNRIQQMRYHRYHRLERFAGVGDLRAAYDSGIRYVDTELGRLFGFLKETGIYDEALIVVTSDHGESLFERGRYFGHTHTLNDQEVRIPLIVRLPHSANKGRRQDLVQIVDIAPLILEEVGLEPRGLAGRNPLRVSGEADPRSLVWGEAVHTGARFARSRDWKIITPPNAQWKKRRRVLFQGAEERFPTGWQIFDLAEDPMELENLFESQPELPNDVQRLIEQVKGTQAPASQAESRPLPEGELAENLRALGYVQ